MSLGEQHPGSVNNYEKSAAFIIIRSANGWTFKPSGTM